MMTYKKKSGQVALEPDPWFTRVTLHDNTCRYHGSGFTVTRSTPARLEIKESVDASIELKLSELSGNTLIHDKGSRAGMELIEKIYF